MSECVDCEIVKELEARHKREMVKVESLLKLYQALTKDHIEQLAGIHGEPR